MGRHFNVTPALCRLFSPCTPLASLTDNVSIIGLYDARALPPPNTDDAA